MRVHSRAATLWVMSCECYGGLEEDNIGHNSELLCLSGKELWTFNTTPITGL